jgi:hypothetical protein
MAVQLQFLSVIVPIIKIEEHYSGGIRQYLTDSHNALGKTIWCDSKLLRNGAMNDFDIEIIVEFWKKLGLKIHEFKDGNPSKWIDVCVVDELWGPTLDCDWLVMDRKTRSVYMKGEEQGEVYGRDKFSPNFL